MAPLQRTLRLREMPLGLGKLDGVATVRTVVFLAIMFISTVALAQETAPAWRPTVGGKALVQVKPKAPSGCKLVGTVKGTKLWAGDCAASESKTATDSEATAPKSLSDQAVEAIPKGHQ
jgi:hypothetical protein